jgi:hypothetical protein
MRPIQLFIVSFIICGSNALAQEQPNTFVFEGNNFRWNQSTNGSLFFDEAEGLPGLNVPLGEENYSIFGSALWLGGINESEELKISFRKFCQSDNEACYENWGPLKLNGELNSTEDVEGYNMIWFVTADQIENQVIYSNCLNDPNCDEATEFPNYEIPADFLSWPAEGGEGYAENLAPFEDRNENGIYDPESGDHPAICGDFSSYAIWNDLGTDNILQDGFEIGLEVHTIVYGYEATEGSEFNTLFVQHKLYNRGTETLTDTYTGFWTDFDLGNPSDDYVATDVERSMFYVYNGDALDEGSASGPGYGSDIPAMGIKVLAGPFQNANGVDDSAEYLELYANESFGFNDGVIDNERRGLYSALYHNNTGGPQATWDPQLAIDYYNYSKGIWRDGTPMTVSGYGYNPADPDLPLARYTFLGTSDPLFAGTNGEDPNYPIEGGWTEENEGNPPSDRRMVGSSGPFTFAPGDIQHIDLAYIFARESFDDEETVIETLQRFADEVEGMQCDPLPAIVLSTDKSPERKPLQVYPNPSSESFSFDLHENSGQLTLIDITGKVVLQQNLNSGVQHIEVAKLSDGIYIIQVRSKQSIYHGKVIIEN